MCFLSLTQKAHDVDLSLVKNKNSRPSFKTVKKDFIQEGVAAVGLKCYTPVFPTILGYYVLLCNS